MMAITFFEMASAIGFRVQLRRDNPFVPRRSSFLRGDLRIKGIAAHKWVTAQQLTPLRIAFAVPALGAGRVCVRTSINHQHGDPS